MATVKDILVNNDRPVPSIGPQVTVLQAAKQMNGYKVGALVVCANGECLGIFTERDLLRCFASTPDVLQQTLVDAVMTRDLLVCSPNTTIKDARLLMVARKIRNLPVIDTTGAVIGLISLGDLDAHELGDHELENHYLKKYLYTRN